MTSLNNEAVSKETAIAVSKEIEKAITAIFTKHNLTQNKISTKYGTNYSIKIEANAVNLNDAGVNVCSIEAQQWIAVGKDYGFENPAAQLGKVVRWNSRDMRFDGINVNKSKFPIYVTDVITQKPYGVPYTFITSLPDFDKTLVNTWLAKRDLGLEQEYVVTEFSTKKVKNA
jgi:hypothetical protein